MTRRRNEHGPNHDLVVLAAAIATLAAAFLAWHLTETPAAGAAPSNAPEQAGRSATALSGLTSRSSTRTPLRGVGAPDSRDGSARTGKLDRAVAGQLTPTLRCVRHMESHGNYHVVAWYGGLRYAGAWQFADATWESVTSLPAPASSYPKRVQDRAAVKLWAEGAGAAHWSTAGMCDA